MHMQIYVPVRYASHWSPEEDFIGWEAFLRTLTHAAGSVAVSGANITHFVGYTSASPVLAPTYRVEAFPTANRADVLTETVIREYAEQLLTICGEPTIVIVIGGKPEVLR